VSADPDAARDPSKPADRPDLYRCGTAARWLPRLLAASVLTAAVLAAFRFDPAQTLTASKYLRNVLAVFGGVLALWLVRKAGEVHAVLVLGREELTFRYGEREFSLRLGDLDRVEYETPFAQSRTWLPALVLRDRFGQPWRVSAFLENGDRFLDQLLVRTDRNDLRAWAETLNLRAVLARSRRRVAIGYISAAAFLVAGIAYYLH
jgi:hypothetical protein